MALGIYTIIRLLNKRIIVVKFETNNLRLLRSNSSKHQPINFKKLKIDFSYRLWRGTQAASKIKLDFLK
jgi:hypothetical protein